MTVLPFKHVTVLFNSEESSGLFATSMRAALEAFYAEMFDKEANEPGAPRKTIVVTPVMSIELIAALTAPGAFTIMSREATPTDVEAEE